MTEVRIPCQSGELPAYLATPRTSEPCPGEGQDADSFRTAGRSCPNPPRASFRTTDGIDSRKAGSHNCPSDTQRLVRIDPVLTCRIVVLALIATALNAQTNAASLAARQWRKQHEASIVGDLVSLSSIPNYAGDADNIQRNARTIMSMMQQRGMSPSMVTVPGANPIVFGEIKTPDATRTIGFYAHYDGQPVIPGEWATPPFAPTLRDRALEQGGQVIAVPPPSIGFNPESRLYARSAGDDKAPIVSILAAVDAIRAAGRQIRSNIKFAFEGEEEVGSPHLEQILSSNRKLFAGDLWLICDSPTHPSRRQQIVFGAPGLVKIDLTVFGARVELHGGHYGNWAPNPALMMSRLLASMEDDEGHILIDHFYDGAEPLTETEKRAVAEVPEVDLELMKDYWLGSTLGAPRKLAELITLPILNIRGLSSAHVGADAAAVVPATAMAAIMIAPMKGMEYQRCVALLIEHVQKQGFFVVDHEPTAEIRMAHPKVAMVTVRSGGYNASRTPMDLPISQELIRVVESARGPAVKLPTMGGSVPLEMIERTLGTRTIVMPIANHDDNQHSFNENLRIQNLWDGIELMAALLTM